MHFDALRSRDHLIIFEYSGIAHDIKSTWNDDILFAQLNTKEVTKRKKKRFLL